MAQTTMEGTTEAISKVILDGHSDIAERGDLTKMRVQAPGRRTFQKVWIWKSSNQADNDHESGGGKTDSYTPEAYGPGSKSWKPVSKLPTTEELETHANAYEVLEVGLIDGANLNILLNEKGGVTTARNLGLEKQRKQGEPLDRPEHALRVFAPISATVEDAKKYLVGCHPVGGRLQGKRIKKDIIFFYPEFWTLVADRIPNKIMNISARKAEMGPVIAEESAQQKVKQAQPAVAMTLDAASNSTSSNPPALTQNEKLTAAVSMLWEAGDSSEELYQFNAAIAHMEDAVPGLRDGPSRVNDGVKAFLVFHRELTEGGAKQLSNELKDAHEFMPRIEPAFILMVHEVLREDKAASDQLIASLLPAFLDVYSEMGGGSTLNEIRRILPAVLRMTKVCDRHRRTIGYLPSK